MGILNSKDLRIRTIIELNTLVIFLLPEKVEEGETSLRCFSGSNSTNQLPHLIFKSNLQFLLYPTSRKFKGLMRDK